MLVLAAFLPEIPPSSLFFDDRAFYEVFVPLLSGSAPGGSKE